MKRFPRVLSLAVVISVVILGIGIQATPETPVAPTQQPQVAPYELLVPQEMEMKEIEPWTADIDELGGQVREEITQFYQRVDNLGKRISQLEARPPGLTGSIPPVNKIPPLLSKADYPWVRPEEIAALWRAIDEIYITLDNITGK